jgi:hypothetical protein
MKTYKVIAYYKDAPELCGEVYTNESNLYSYQQAIELIQAFENDATYTAYGHRLEEAA